VLCEAHNIDLLVAIFHALYFRMFIQQIKEFGAVDFVKTDNEEQFWIGAQLLHDVGGREQVKARISLRHCTHHGVSLAGARLTVRKAGRIDARKEPLNKWLDAMLVNLHTVSNDDTYLLVVRVLAKAVVELVAVAVQIFCHVYFVSNGLNEKAHLLQFFDIEFGRARHLKNVNVAFMQLLVGHRSLPHNDSNLRRH
jgi:hypothetical protein